MWQDNETERDFLNFSGVADTVAEIIIRAKGEPVSIGVSGAWGVGKSTMINLIRRALEARDGGDPSDFVFVEFNAWLYQGYDDARASLLDVIATALEIQADERETGVEKVQALIKRINWLRAAKLTTGSGLALALGLPPTGLIGEAFRVGKAVLAGDVTSDDLDAISAAATEAAGEDSGLINPATDSSPPKEIHAIRESFTATLSELGITLVVLIDDLDRCLPRTTISTLEAIRLFLFLENTAFVIAADDTMIKHAVRRHFEGIENESLVTSYFDKLIQIPIRVPPLGTQEVRAYMMLLFVENSTLSEDDKEAIREKVCSQLQQTWRGQRVDRAFIETTYGGFSAELLGRFDTADRLAPLMVSASQIAGNPRLIKRFLNALSIRMEIARTHDVAVDEAVLAKLMLFERSGPAKAYAELIKVVNENEDGRPTFLAPWEQKALTGQELELDGPWDDAFVLEWLTLQPRLADIDLRGALYVSREHTPLVTPEDRLSSAGAELLSAILENPDMAGDLRAQLEQLPRTETTIIMDRVLATARQQQEWGTPPILNAALAVAAADPALGVRLAGFLQERPPGQVTASIVPKINGHSWTSMVYDRWLEAEVGTPVKRAIEQQTAPADGR